jgi:hypothetical protein
VFAELLVFRQLKEMLGGEELRKIRQKNNRIPNEITFLSRGRSGFGIHVRGVLHDLRGNPLLMLPV